MPDKTYPCPHCGTPQKISLENTTLADRIKLFRAINRLSATDLGKKLGVKPSTVCHWESGHSCPPLSTLKMMARVFEISLAELVCDSE